MTIFEKDEFFQRGAGWQPVASMLAGWIGRWSAYRARRRSLAVLSQMEDWQLRDVGLTRDQLDSLLQRYRIRSDRAAFEPRS